MDKFRTKFEEIKVQARDLVDKVRNLIHEGNIRRIIIKDEKGNTFMEVPVTVAALGTIAAPLLAGIGAIAALVSHFTLVVERNVPDGEAGPPATPAEPPDPQAS